MAVIALPKQDAPSSAAERLRELGRLQDIPAVRQVGTLLMVAVAVALGLWMFFWTQSPDYVPVQAGLDASASSQAASILGAQKIPYKIQESGAITVSADKVGQARLALAGAGISAAPPSSMDTIGKEGSFGTSQFMENARYQRAQELDLASTIATLQPVREARVHLAVPKPSAFTRDREAASASVALELHPGTTLDQGQVRAIVHLVSNSVSNLPPDRVTVVDQFGNMLNSIASSPEDAADARKFEQQRKLETTYVSRIRDLLEPLTGPGRISSQVAVDLDFSETQEAAERFGPAPSIVRSEQVSETNTGGPPAPTGVPGSASNTPGTPALAQAADDAQAATPAAGAAPGSRSAVRNYEIDRTLTHTRQEQGRVRRITAAVLIDNVPAATPGADGAPTYRALNDAELQNIRSLVEQAIGFDTERGDIVSVVNAPFARPDFGGDTGTTPFWKTLLQQRDMLRPIIGGIALLVLILAVLRPAMRALISPQGKRAQPALASDAQDDDDLREALGQDLRAAAEPAPIALPASGPTRLESNVEQARKAVADDPKRVAEVIRGWVDGDD